MRTRDRSQSVRGAHADEIIEPGLSKDDVVKIIEDTAAADTPVTLTGLPSVGSPYFVAARVDADGQVYVTVFFQNISAALKRFWITHKIVRSDGTYGKPRRQAVPVTVQNKIDGQMQVEIHHGWRPNHTVHLVLIEGKFVSAIDDDGGRTDQNPPVATYQDRSVPNGSQLASFSTGGGTILAQVDNEVMNSKGKWSGSIYVKPNSVVEGGAATDLAIWRHPIVGAQIGGDPARRVTTATANLNYWLKTGTNSPGFVLTSADPDRDLCVRLSQRPWDGGEPLLAATSALKTGSWTIVEDNLVQLVCYLEDDVAGRIASTTINAVGDLINVGTAIVNFWQHLQFPATTVSAAYAPAGASRQWLRFGLRGSGLGAGKTLILYKVQGGHQQGAYRPHQNDRAQDTAPDAQAPTAGGGRGTVGIGITGSESTAGEIIRPISD